MTDNYNPDGDDWWQRQTTLTKALVIAVPVGLAVLTLVAIIVIALRTSRPASALRRRSMSAWPAPDTQRFVAM